MGTQVGWCLARLFSAFTSFKTRVEEYGEEQGQGCQYSSRGLGPRGQALMETSQYVKSMEFMDNASSSLLECEDLRKKLDVTKIAVDAERQQFIKGVHMLQDMLAKEILEKNSLSDKLQQCDVARSQAAAEIMVLRMQQHDLQGQLAEANSRLVQLGRELRNIKTGQTKTLSSIHDSLQCNLDPSRSRAEKDWLSSSKESGKDPGIGHTNSLRKAQQYFIQNSCQGKLKLVMGRPLRRHAIVVLVMMGDSYSLGACVLASKLKELKTQADLVCMVTNDVSNGARACLGQVFDVIYDVPYMEYKCEEEIVRPNGAEAIEPGMVATWKERLFTKWNVLGLTSYEKVLLVDADFLPLVSFDEVFGVDAPAAMFMPRAPDGSLGDPYSDLRHGEKISYAKIDKAITCALNASPDGSKGSFLASGSLVLLEPSIDALMSLRAFVASRQPFGLERLHNGVDGQSIVLFFNSNYPHKPWSHISKVWARTGADENAKAYHYIDSKPWSMAASVILTQDLHLWYAAAADLLRAYPDTAFLFGKCLGPNFMQVFERLQDGNSCREVAPKAKSASKNSEEALCKLTQRSKENRFVDNPSTLSLNSRQIKNKPSKGGPKRVMACPKKRVKQIDFRRKISPAFFPDYFLSQSELRMYDFPTYEYDSTSGRICPKGYVETAGKCAGSRTVALDCEMCETTKGSELTRMSLVDEEGKLLVDIFVQPSNEVTNYWTQYSGITREILENVTTTLEEAQAIFLHHVSADTVLIGHSLNNDLRAIKVVHTKIIDTVVLYPHPRGYPARSSLKYLASQVLHEMIQEGSHDSVVDARVALKLVKQKINQERIETACSSFA